jgi:hypothetical protein
MRSMRHGVDGVIDNFGLRLKLSDKTSAKFGHRQVPSRPTYSQVKSSRLHLTNYDVIWSLTDIRYSTEPNPGPYYSD